MPHSQLPQSAQIQSFDELSLSDIQLKLREMQQFLSHFSQLPVLASALAMDTSPVSLLGQARQGDAHACYQLGMEYLQGQNRPLSLSHAACWFQLAALQQHSKAEHALVLLRHKLSPALWQQAQFLAAERLEQI